MTHTNTPIEAIFEQTPFDGSLPAVNTFHGHLRAILEYAQSIGGLSQNLSATSSGMVEILKIAASQLIQELGPKESATPLSPHELAQQKERILEFIQNEITKAEELAEKVSLLEKQIASLPKKEELADAMEEMSFVWRCIQEFAAKVDFEKRQLKNTASQDDAAELAAPVVGPEVVLPAYDPRKILGEFITLEGKNPHLVPLSQKR
jgi:hypothetical protein